MLGSNFLDTLITFAFLFASASAACSALFETFSSILGLRGFFLKKTIEAMLGDKASLVTEHPALKSLNVGIGRFPSYLDPQLFGEIVYSKVVANGSTSPPTTDIPHLEPFFITATSPSGAVLNLAAWFTACTYRTSGVYRRWSQLGLALSAVPVCFLFPIDAIAILKTLYANSALRDKLLAAVTVATTPNNPLDLKPFVYPSQGVLGIFLAAAAISIGAPFWFDLAKNLLRLNPRQTGPAPESAFNAQ
jgi:hypothetical protein